MKPLTFDQWKQAGYHVRKGQKSHTTNRAGEPTFTRDQVEETKAFGYLQEEDVHGMD